MQKLLISILIVSSLPLLYTCQSSEDEWKEDIDFLTEQLPKKHIDFYKLMDSATFEKETSNLKSKVDELENYEVVLELQKILAKLGVSHSKIPLYGGPFHRLPLALEMFDDGLFVYGIEDEKEKFLAQKIIGINNIPIEKVYKKLKVLVSFENEYWLKNELTRLLIVPKVLTYAGISNKGDSLVYNLESGEDLYFSNKNRKRDLIYDANIMSQPWFKNQDKYYWYEVFENRLMYIQYNKCQNDKKYPFQNFVDDVTSSIEKEKVSTIFIDLRLNGGGDSRIIKPLIDALKQYKNIAYYTGISRRTFSSGRFAARDLLVELNSKLIGEPTGGSPNSYGYNKTITLPNSKVPVNYCIRYFTLFTTELDYFKPYIRIDYKSADYFQGIDPVYEYVSAHHEP